MKLSNRKALVLLFFVIALLFQTGCAALQTRKDASGPDKEIFWPSPPMEARIKFVRAIDDPADIGVKKEKGWFKKALDFITGGEGGGNAIASPYGLYFDSEKDRLYVADRGLKGIHRYDLAKGKAVLLEEAGEELFYMPVDITIGDNKLYVSDTVLNKIIIFSTIGNLLGEIKGFGRVGGITYDRKNDRLYVVDVLGSRVKAFDSDGDFLFAFGKTGGRDGEFNRPVHIWVDKDGKIYVTDSMNFRVQVFDDRGNHLRSVGQLGDVPGYFSRPRGVAVDSDGNIYVVDANFDNVQIFNREGELLLVFGTTGRKPGKFLLPSGIFIDDNDRIYVSDSYNSRIQVFQYLKQE